MGFPSVLVDKKGNRILGMVPDSEILAHQDRHSKALMQDIYHAPEFASHRFLAGNTTVPLDYRFDEHLEKTIEFLRSGNYLNVDIFGLRICDDGNLIGPLGTTLVTIHPNDMLETYVVIHNMSIGHSLIPEVRDLHETWTQFTVTDRDGAKIYESGFLKPGGMLEAGSSQLHRPAGRCHR